MQKVALLLYLSLVVLQIWAQNPAEYNKAQQYLADRGEVYFRFDMRSNDLYALKDLISIDHKQEGFWQYAYANQNEFDAALQVLINYEVLTPPSMQFSPTARKKKDQLYDYQYYPSYEEYVALMENFAAQYPDICKLETFGESVQGRKLLAIKLSDNVQEEENEPDFLYTSSMHGDEITGYVLMLRLIHYLLENYENQAEIQHLLDSTEIWINPLSNPDGTYHAGNHSVWGATRYNANAVDLNRNFPDPRAGQNPDGNAHQAENVAMMEYMQAHNFVLSANFHGGTEVMNYPWDTWTATHADNAWYAHVARQYVDTVHQYADENSYFDGFDRGIVKGSVWYIITGGRQDYTNFYLNGREITVEISDNKTVPEYSLDDHWQYNYRSLLNYIKRCHWGLTGIVTDKENGWPLQAKIELVGHDTDRSYVFSETKRGNYHRMLAPGTYNLKVSKAGYADYESEITIDSYQQRLELDVELEMIGDITAVDIAPQSTVELSDNPMVSSCVVRFSLQQAEQVQLRVFNLSGKQVLQKNEFMQAGNKTIQLQRSDLPPGFYALQLRYGKQSFVGKLLVQD